MGILPWVFILELTPGYLIEEHLVPKTECAYQMTPHLLHAV